MNWNAAKKITFWFKSIGWVTTLGTVFTAVLFALAATRSVKSNRKAKQKDRRVVDLLEENRSRHMEEAMDLSESAAKDKANAIERKVQAALLLEELGKKNEDIDDIADRFNSRRVRRDW